MEYNIKDMRKRRHIISALFVISLFTTGVYGFTREEKLAWEYLLGQVGATLQVAENPYNTLAKDLQNWEDDLNKREQELAEGLVIQNGSEVSESTFLVLVIITSILGGLLVVNFYLDWKRRR